MGRGKVHGIGLVGLVGLAVAGCSQGPRHSAVTTGPGSTSAASTPSAPDAQQVLLAASADATLDAPSGSSASASAAPSRTTAGPASTPSRRASVQRDAFVEFGADASIEDAKAEPLADLLYVVESDGTLRVLDTSGERPSLVRAFLLFPEPLGRARGVGELELVSADLALLPTQGAGFEGIALFDPREARSAEDVTWFDVGALSATWPAGATNSQGVDVSERPLRLTEVTGTTVVGDTLFLCAANLDAEGDHNPGVVLALRLDALARQLEPLALLRTSAFNPTGLTRVGDLLFVTNTGSFGQTGASIDVIDVRSARRLDTIAFPERLADGRVPDPCGPLAVQPGGFEAYVGSLEQARVYRVDLRTRTFVDDVTLPRAAARNSTRELTLSQDGATLYAANAEAGGVSAIDVATQEVTALAPRAGDRGRVSEVVVQPTRDGGEALLALVNDVPPAARQQPDVRASLDRVALPAAAAPR